MAVTKALLLLAFISTLFENGVWWSPPLLGCIRQGAKTASKGQIGDLDSCMIFCEHQEGCQSVEFRTHKRFPTCNLNFDALEGEAVWKSFTAPCLVGSTMEVDMQFLFAEKRAARWEAPRRGCMLDAKNATFKAESMEECQQLCEGRPSLSCLSASFFPNRGLCYLSDKNRLSPPAKHKYSRPCGLEDKAVLAERFPMEDPSREASQDCSATNKRETEANDEKK